MLKPVLLFILSIFAFSASAQKEINFQKDTITNYFKKPIILVSKTNNPDYFRKIFPSYKGKHTVKEYYMSGKLKFEGKSFIYGVSLVNEIPLTKDGKCVEYFENGNKKLTATYKKGAFEDSIYLYYPSGELYAVKTASKGKPLLLIECRDSTGKALAQNGEGEWHEYDEQYKNILFKGKVKDGRLEDIWYNMGNDAAGTTLFAKDSTIIKPEFKGGLHKFAEYLARKIIYPADARDNRVTGRVYVSFIVETNGTLSELKVVNGIGYGCDEEVLRVLGQSPPWAPAIKDGKSIRMWHSLPIALNLAFH